MHGFVAGGDRQRNPLQSILNNGFSTMYKPRGAAATGVAFRRAGSASPVGRAAAASSIRSVGADIRLQQARRRPVVKIRRAREGQQTNAVPPNVAAPTMAKISRQLAEGTLSWARTSVAWWPEIPLGTAKRRAIAARSIGDLVMSGRIWTPPIAIDF
jgi:hypothetical protein